MALVSCTTVSEISSVGLRAPDASPDNFMASSKSNSVDQATIVLNLYRESQQFAASGRSAEACTGFLKISQENSIPEAVKALAQIRAASTCMAPDQANLPSSIPKWLKEESIKAKLFIAERTNDPIQQAQALLESASFEKTQKLRLDRAQKGLDILTALPPSIKKTQAARNSIKIAQAKIVELAPRFHIQFPEAATIAPSMIAIANDLRSARKFDDARRIYSQVANDERQSNIDRLKALDGIRMSFKLQLRTEEFLKASRTWLDFAKKQFLRPGLNNKDHDLIKTYVESGVLYARAIWTDHRTTEALRFLEDLEASVGVAVPTISLHESALIRARIAEERGDFETMNAILSKLEIERLPDRATKARFLWFKGWNLRRISGQSEAAIKTLEEANKFEDSHSSYARNVYWIARLKREIGQIEEAKKNFEKLTEISHFGFYGILAHQELGKAFSALPDNSEFYRPRSRSPLTDELRVPIEWFIALGEVEVGRKYLEAYPARHFWNSDQSMAYKEAALKLMSRLELFAQATSKMDELNPEERVQILRNSPGILFPLPYEARIREEASKNGLDPAIIYSIIRQESLFNTFARSPADAFGLMQLIPEVANQSAGRLGVSISGPDDLYDADINISLGTAFLKDLFKKYDGRFILAVSAYNANDRAIQGWLQTRMRKDPIEFIEEIPYDETRNYVKLVLRNFVTYQRRLSSNSILFPNWTLRLNTGSN